GGAGSRVTAVRVAAPRAGLLRPGQDDRGAAGLGGGGGDDLGAAGGRPGRGDAGGGAEGGRDHAAQPPPVPPEGRPPPRPGRGLAEAAADGRIDFAGLRDMPDEEAVNVLVALKGVGLWTAETYLMFCEGRLDVFPGGDVALQEAMRWADQAEVRPTEKQAYA